MHKEELLNLSLCTLWLCPKDPADVFLSAAQFNKIKTVETPLLFLHLLYFFVPQWPKAIRFSALDYLLKPIDVLELQNAVNRHIVKQQNQNQQLQVSNLLTNLQQKDHVHFKLALSTTEGVSFFDTSEILYCESENNYTRFTFIKNKPILVSKTLGGY